MTPARALQALEAQAGCFLPSAKRVGSGAERYVAGLQATLAITEDQMDVWTAVADSVWANRRRMESGECVEGVPFGALEDRLAALASMRQAAARLYITLDTDQQRKALQLLPLCCLPRAAALLVDVTAHP